MPRNANNLNRGSKAHARDQMWALTTGCGAIQQLISDVCAPLSNMTFDWLPTLGRTVASIGEIVSEAIG